MNIMLAVTNLKHENGGVCTHVFDLCREYAKRGSHVVLLADGTDYLEKIQRIPNLTYVELPFSKIQTSPGSFAAVFSAMRKLCVEHRIQIVHLHGQCIIPVAWLIRLTKGIPFLWTNHVNEIPKRKLLAAMQKIMRFPVISVSMDLRMQLISELKIRKKDIFVVNNGVDLKDYAPLTAEEQRMIREKFAVEEDCYTICELARLNYGKGQDLLIKAVNELKRNDPDRKLQVLFAGVGDRTWFAQEVERFAQEHNIKYSYLGFQSPREVFGISDLAALPSLFEGFPLACVEALSMECPVVRADTPGYSDMSDVVLVHKKGNLSDLVEKLEYAITHREEMKRMAQQGKQKCKDVFGVEMMAEKTLNIYEKIRSKA